jgi:transposase
MIKNNQIQIKTSVKIESSQIQIEWRKSKVAELNSQGHSQPEISSILHVSIGTVNRDLSTLRQQARKGDDR